jgi:hypothetical protein
MVLLFAMPAVAVCVAVAIVLSRLRALEELSTELVSAVRRTSELRVPLAEVRHELDRSERLVDRIWSHWQ